MIIVPLANPFSIFKHGALPAHGQEWFRQGQAGCRLIQQAAVIGRVVNDYDLSIYNAR